MVRTIAIVHNAYAKASGEEVVIDNLAALLAERGLNIQRFSRSSTEIEKTMAGKISAFFSGIHNPLSRKMFGQFLRQKRPDIVHIHNLYPLISPSILPECTAQDIPVVMTVHNFRLSCPNGLMLSHGELCDRCLGGREYWCFFRNCENSLLKSTGYALRTAAARILKRYYDHVDHFICLSAFQRDVLIREGLPADRVTVLANPMAFTGDSSIGNGDYVAYVGRISPEKDIWTLVKAACRLGDVPFKFAGSYHRMQEVIKKKPNNCEFLGQLDAKDLAHFYRNARMVIFATRCYEGFPTVLLEAMSYGLPIICSRIGGLPEIVKEGKTGLFYKPGNVDELADHVRTLWQDAALCRQLGDGGRQKGLKEYATDGLLSRLLAIYEKVIMEGGSRHRVRTIFLH
jgi:glycosyltransferase involved in cell wall biosynthesis